jgi:hypothetical protein
MIDNENQFYQLRRKLMGQPLPRQSQMESQIAQSKQDNEVYTEGEEPNQTVASTSTIHQQGKNPRIISSFIILMKTDSHQ